MQNVLFLQHISHLADNPSMFDYFTDNVVFNTRPSLPGTFSKVRVGGDTAVAFM